MFLVKEAMTFLAQTSLCDANLLKVKIKTCTEALVYHEKIILLKLFVYTESLRPSCFRSGKGSCYKHHTCKFIIYRLLYMLYIIYYVNHYYNFINIYIYINSKFFEDYLVEISQTGY